MPDETSPTLSQSAMRGLACKCPRCGKGKLYAGFLSLRPNCEACGLDYAFIDAGDGPAVFIIMIAGAIVVGCGPDRRGEVPAAVLAARRAVAAADSRDHAAAAALDEVAADRAAVSSQGGAGPADRSRAEMTAIAASRRSVAGLGVFTLAMVALLCRPRSLAVAAPGREARLIAALTERLAAAPVALPPPAQWSALTPARTNSAASVLPRRYQPRPDAMVYSSGSAMRDDVSGPGTWAFMPATLAGRRDRRDQCRLRAEHDAGSRPAGSRGDAADHRRAGDADRLSSAFRKPRAR